MNKQSSIPFGNFVLNRLRGRLEDATGAERVLRPKSYRVLEVLAERSGQLVSKDDLINETWPNVFVSDDSLAHCISDIRRALGSDGTTLLRTIARRGYMLSAPEQSNQAPKPWILELRIVRTGAIALALGLGLVVTSAVDRWWTLANDTSEPAAVALESPVHRANALLEARDWRQRNNNEQARVLLETALAQEPEHANVLASLGLTYWLEVQHLAWGGGRREMERALGFVERAVALGGGARSYRLLAEMRLLAPFPDERSPVDALASARAAVAIDGNDPDNLAVLAQALALTGQPGEAAGMMERALGLQSAPPDWHRQIAGLAYLLSRQPARAAEQLGPVYGAGTFTNARWWPGWLFAASLAHAGRIEDAAMVIEAATARRPERSVAAVAQTFHGLADGKGLRLLLDGLRLAGMRS